MAARLPSGLRHRYQEWRARTEDHLRTNGARRLPCMGCGLKGRWTVKLAQFMWLTPSHRSGAMPGELHLHALCPGCHDEWIDGRALPGWPETTTEKEEKEEI